MKKKGELFGLLRAQTHMHIQAKVEKGETEDKQEQNSCLAAVARRVGGGP